VNQEDRFVAIEGKLELTEQCNANICKRLDEQKAANDKLRKRCHEIETDNGDIWDKIDALNAWADEKDDQIRFLEAWQKEQGAKESDVLEALSLMVKRDRARIEKEMIEGPAILDEPTKVGDYAEVVGPLSGGTSLDVGKIVYIDRIIHKEPTYVSSSLGYPASSLRKLSDAEIAKRLNV
jgi:hypothetical protein